MASPTLPLELAATFVAPADFSSLAACCRALRASSNGYWKDLYARRYPCLASLPGLGQLSDAYALVRNLRAAAPPPGGHAAYYTGPGAEFPPVPRDGEGRAVPLRGDTILSVQILRVGRQRPLAYGSVRLADTSLHARSSLTNGSFPWNHWMFNVDVEFIEEDGVQTLISALGLPRISLDLNNPAAETTPPFPDVIDLFLMAFDRNLRQEIYIVAGDSIYRMDGPVSALEGDNYLDSHYHDFVQGPSQRWSRTGKFPDEDDQPWLPLECEFGGLNVGLTSRWTVGSYHLDARHSRYTPYVFEESLSMEFCLFWEEAYDNRLVREDPGPDEWNWFCRLLATAHPVLFPR